MVKNNMKVVVDEEVFDNVKDVRIVFGPHYFFEIVNDDKEPFIVMLVTHHGIKVPIDMTELRLIIEKAAIDNPQFKQD